MSVKSFYVKNDNDLIGKRRLKVFRNADTTGCCKAVTEPILSLAGGGASTSIKPVCVAVGTSPCECLWDISSSELCFSIWIHMQHNNSSHQLSPENGLPFQISLSAIAASYQKKITPK